MRYFKDNLAFDNIRCSVYKVYDDGSFDVNFDYPSKEHNKGWSRSARTWESYKEIVNKSCGEHKIKFTEITEQEAFLEIL